MPFKLIYKSERDFNLHIPDRKNTAPRQGQNRQTSFKGIEIHPPMKLPWQLKKEGNTQGKEEVKNIGKRN